MNYVKAKNVLPAQLLEKVQEYASGTYLYIPQKCENRKKLGRIKRFQSLVQKTESADIQKLQGRIFGQRDFSKILSERKISLQNHLVRKKSGSKIKNGSTADTAMNFVCPPFFLPERIFSFSFLNCL